MDFHHNNDEDHVQTKTEKSENKIGVKHEDTFVFPLFTGANFNDMKNIFDDRGENRNQKNSILKASRDEKGVTEYFILPQNQTRFAQTLLWSSYMNRQPR